MTDGHPLVWLWLVLVGSTIALHTSNAMLLLLIVAALVATGFLAAGPRRASFVTALGASLVAVVLWILLTLMLPRGSGADALLVLPSFSPGPGVAFGGPLDLDAVIAGLVSALRAVVVILLFGLAGQLVSARGWLALSRSTLGAGAPALHPVATLGEATVEALHTRQRVARQGWGRGAAAGWLTSLLIAGRDIARADRAASSPRRSVEAIRLVFLMILAVAPVLLLAFGVLPSVVTDNIYGTDIIALIVLLAVAAGMVLPGKPGRSMGWRLSDIPPAAVALLLTAGWVLRDVLGQSTSLDPPADAPFSLPWAIAGAVALLPLAVGASGQRTARRVVSIHA